MELCHGLAKAPIRLSATKKYAPWEIHERCKRTTGPFWLRVEDKVIPVPSAVCLEFACQVSAAYHDWIAYNAPEDDGFEEDMAERERVVQMHMDDPLSDEDVLTADT